MCRIAASHAHAHRSGKGLEIIRSLTTGSNLFWVNSSRSPCDPVETFTVVDGFRVLGGAAFSGN